MELFPKQARQTAVLLYTYHTTMKVSYCKCRTAKTKLYLTGTNKRTPPLPLLYTTAVHCYILFYKYCAPTRGTNVLGIFSFGKRSRYKYGQTPRAVSFAKESMYLACINGIKCDILKVLRWREAWAARALGGRRTPVYQLLNLTRLSIHRRQSTYRIQ